VNNTAIHRIDVFEALAIGAAAVVARIGKALDRVLDQPFWVHLDVDVLDQTGMPAVDCPGSPGIAPDDLVEIVCPLVVDHRCRGMTVTVFDPDLDPDGRFAAMIVSILGRLPFATNAR
jgi:arginase